MSANAKVIDPVCGMEIDVTAAVASATYEGETYYFCTRACEREFAAQPERYAAKEAVGSCCSGTSCCS